jgi:hypothetical protein
MKKVIIAVALLITSFGFTSCRGKYTCTCTFNGNVVYEAEDEGKRSDAESDCNLRKTTIVGQTWDCDLR